MKRNQNITCTMDYVADVLKTVANNGQPKKQDVDKAISQHNDKVGGLKDLEYGGKTETRPKAFEKLQEQYVEQCEKVKLQEREIKELRDRLSSLAGQKLTDGNAEITDLSDVFRPTKLAEHLRQMYDDAWLQAFEELEKLKVAPKESGIISNLSDLLKDVEEFCAALQGEQLQRLTDYIRDDLRTVKMRSSYGVIVGNEVELNSAQEALLRRTTRELQKSLAVVSASSLAQLYYQYNKQRRGMLYNVNCEGVNVFVRESLKYVWLMKVQDPPMVFLWADTQVPIDKSRFTFYTQRGETVVQTVWPAVLLHEAGPLMSKGIVQAE